MGVSCLALSIVHTVLVLNSISVPVDIVRSTFVVHSIYFPVDITNYLCEVGCRVQKSIGPSRSGAKTCHLCASPVPVERRCYNLTPWAHCY